MNGTTSQRLLAGCGMAAPVIRWAVIGVVAFLTPGYEPMQQFISELSAQDAPYKGITTLASLYLVGGLLVLFSLALFRAASTFPGRLGALLMGASGIAYVMIGVFPCDPGCSMTDPSLTMRLHLLAGFAAMTLQMLVPLIYGLSAATPADSTRMRRLSLFLGGIGLFGMFWLYSAYFGLDLGLPAPPVGQKLAVLALDIWVFVAARKLRG